MSTEAQGTTATGGVRSVPTSEALEGVRRLLDGIDHAARQRLASHDRLTLAEDARRLADRFESLAATLLAEADAAGASLAARGTPTTSWLSLPGAITARQASGMVFTARDLARHPQVRDAALAGEVRIPEARALAKVIDELPDTLTDEQRERATSLLIERTQGLPAHRVEGLSAGVLAEVAPESVPSPDDHLARLDAQKRRAHASRGLTFVNDGRGSVLLRGSLPVVDAAPLVRLIDAYVESDRRAGRDAARDRLDPLAETRTPEQRRADALLALVSAHAQASIGPRLAGDRPRVVVTVRESDLRERAEAAGVLAAGDPISAGDLRRLCCDADLTVAVLGAHSEVLDVGRTQRLVTGAVRRALSIRDGGCAFPGCQAPDARCDAHHIVPWWAGGVTAVGNLVLLCPHHHALVEPPRFWSGAPPDRWEVRIGRDGLPEFLPPRRLDPDRTPIAGSHRRPQDAA